MTKKDEGALDDTVAPAGSETPATRVPSTSGGGAAATSPPVVVRSGGRDDYRELTAVDPQHYVVGKEIARGGMGRILTARDRRLGRPVAIKELLTASGDLRARFEREARITAKLQHPSIVNILEAGAWPSGEPFYVMKLVSGDSLDKAVAARATLGERLALLPNVIAVVDALAYAHDKQVIHRDLKPANVLVGEFGETVVIDWGLAKDLADTSGDAPELPVGPYRSAPSAAGATVAGSVMGTPAYMPPEQARGDAVDERADVYALGALLYHVLAGAPPYTGETTDLILDAVIAGPPAPLAARAPGVPPDLVTIVNKAMAHAAADRYPTAKQLAEDLKKFQTGQLVGAHQYSSWQLLRRWLRRHRAPVAVAVVAASLLTVVGAASVRRIVREQQRAEAQRLLAEESRVEAEDLMSFMLVDLRDKLKPLGKLDLLDAVAKKAVDYYARQGDSLSDQDLARRALALRNLGDVLKDQGHADEALREYRASLAISQTLALKAPGNPDYQADLAASHAKVGDVVYAQGNAAGALAEYRSALAIREALAAEHPSNADYQADLAVSHAKIGDILAAQGDASAALAAYRTSSAIREALVATDPTNADRQRALAAGHHKIGNILRDQGDAAGALREYRAALAIFETLAARDPANADRQRDLSIGHDKIADVLFDQGDAAGALGEYRSSLAIREKLAQQDPTNAARQADLAASHAMVGDALRAQGDTPGALREYRLGLAIRETVAAKDPTNADRQRQLAIGHNMLADVLFAQGDAAAALTEYRLAHTIFESLAQKDPTNASRQADLARSHDSVGDLLRTQNNDGYGYSEAALTEYRAALAIRRRLAESDPTNAAKQAELARSHNRVGNVLLAKGDMAGALAEHQAALTIRETLAAKDPTNAERQEGLAKGNDKVGEALLARGEADDIPAAAVKYKAALAIREALLAKNPTNADLQFGVATSHQSVGKALAARSSDEALSEYRLGHAMLERLAASDPTNVKYQGELVRSHWSTGDLLLARGDKAGALKEYEAGLVVARRLQATDATRADFRAFVDGLSNKIATCCKKR